MQATLPKRSPALLSRRWALLGALLTATSPARGEPGVTVKAMLSPSLLTLEDGRRLRLAGIEGALPEHEAARAAAMRALSDLLAGQVLILEPEAPRRDRLGRDLVQAYRQEDGLWLQGRLLRWGHARVDPFSAPVAKVQELYALEAAARSEGAGLWAHPAYRLRSGEPEDLLPWIGSLQVFEGQVAAVGGGRGDLYLNFGSDWKSDATARIARRHLKRFAAAGIDPQALVGARLRLRGWLQSWNGPFLELHSPAQLEIITPAKGEDR